MFTKKTRRLSFEMCVACTNFYPKLGYVTALDCFEPAQNAFASVVGVHLLLDFHSWLQIGAELLGKPHAFRYHRIPLFRQ